MVAFEDRLLILGQNGRLLLVAADPAEYRLMGSAQVCGPNWRSPAYVDESEGSRENTTAAENRPNLWFSPRMTHLKWKNAQAQFARFSEPTLGGSDAHF